jgi:hypothetical protein
MSIKKNGQRLLFQNIPKWQVEKLRNEKVKTEKPGKNIIQATHEWTTVVDSNEKDVETKKFFKKATDGFVTVYNGGPGRPKMIKTSEAVDIIEKSQIEVKLK